MALVRVLLADDHQRMLAEIRVQLGETFEIVGAVEDGKQAVATALQLAPDVLVLDISMPVMNGFQVAEYLRSHKSKTKIVMLTNYQDGEYVAKAFSSGANGYVIKQDLTVDLVTAIRVVLHGGKFMSRSLLH